MCNLIGGGVTPVCAHLSWAILMSTYMRLIRLALLCRWPLCLMTQSLTIGLQSQAPHRYCVLAHCKALSISNVLDFVLVSCYVNLVSILIVNLYSSLNIFCLFGFMIKLIYFLGRPVCIGWYILVQTVLQHRLFVSRIQEFGTRSLRICLLLKLRLICVFWGWNWNRDFNSWGVTLLEGI